MRIFIFILLICWQQSAWAADRNYKVENCDRQKLWADFADDLKWHEPELTEFLNQNIHPNKDRPKLTQSDYKDIDRFDKKIRWHVSECILLMKEINQLTLAAYKTDPKKAWNISWRFNRALVRNDIPFVSKLSLKENRKIFTTNFAPLMPEKTF